jgi:hypothetical protein
MLAICLVLSDCDPETSIAMVIERVEDYQRTQQCYFGVTDTDFRMALLWLAITRDEVDSLDPDQTMASLRGITLRAWVQPILAYNNVYFNDEGEAWDEAGTADDAGHNLPLRRFFTQPANMNREAVAAFFEQQGINAQSIYQWTSRGIRFPQR